MNFKTVEVDMKKSAVLVLVVCVLVFLSGCKASKVAEEGDEEIILIQSTPEIVMITFSMDSRDSIKVINAAKNPGRLRGWDDSSSEPGEGDLVISFLNETNLVCSKIIVQNPLVKRVEYSETDDISTLTAKTIDLDSAEFFIRVQFDECFKHLKVEKYEEEELKLLEYISNFNISR